jgi:quercetin 2,3-dioxygenase
MVTVLKHAKIEPYRAPRRAFSNLGWLTSYRSFNFPNYYSPDYAHLGPISTLNEDIVAPKSGFPMHSHRDAEIFSYILSGELTHRDSTVKKGSEKEKKLAEEVEGGEGDGKLFYRIRPGDVQFSSAGSGVRHSENNEWEGEGEECRFLQIWVLPWRAGLRPVYHTKRFGEAEKRRGFVTIISPLRGGVGGASKEEEKRAEAVVPGTIPIHADFLFGAGIIPVGESFIWKVAGGKGVVTARENRQFYVYLPMMKEGKARVRLNGDDGAFLPGGDGAFVREGNEGDELAFESIGEEEAEIVVLDVNPN